MFLFALFIPYFVSFTPFRLFQMVLGFLKNEEAKLYRDQGSLRDHEISTASFCFYI